MMMIREDKEEELEEEDDHDRIYEIGMEMNYGKIQVIMLIEVFEE